MDQVVWRAAEEQSNIKQYFQTFFLLLFIINNISYIRSKSPHTFLLITQNVMKQCKTVMYNLFWYFLDWFSFFSFPFNAGCKSINSLHDPIGLRLPVWKSSEVGICGPVPERGPHKPRHIQLLLIMLLNTGLEQGVSKQPARLRVFVNNVLLEHKTPICYHFVRGQ